MTKHDESCARVVATLFARMDQGLSEAKSRVFSSQQQDVLSNPKYLSRFSRCVIGIREGGRWSEWDFGVSACGLVCSFGFAFARVFLCIRRRCLLRFIIFREEMILKVAGSGRRTDRLILARPRVN